jgi:hypothetical protein
MEITAVATDQRLTDDDLSQLHLLLTQDMESSRVELHHTAGYPYREHIKQRLEQGQALLRKLEMAVPRLGKTTQDWV